MTNSRTRVLKMVQAMLGSQDETIEDILAKVEIGEVHEI